MKLGKSVKYEIIDIVGYLNPSAGHYIGSKLAVYVSLSININTIPPLTI